MKKEFLKTKSRKNKKRIFRKKNINHIHVLMPKYNLFNFFVYAENILLNKKILAELISTEVGSIFALIQWNFRFHSIV
uniref:Ribosomal protein L20 n=1 Tax=Agarophyton chilense TaxID=2510777 RepID=A0A0D5Y9B7_AGACH|nr:ribosomal protein L20 [Agarophyton chilense]AKA27630.1 ribosomal protein L20 [Agarophyton chilense]ASP44558.1 ribosomal protein L20 [Agarophyton chilense]UAD89517.1 ribosomal protein L20 [Agarophyton chilense]